MPLGDDPPRVARRLLPHGRHRVHAHPGPGGEGLDPAPGGRRRHVSPRRGAAPHPGPAQRRRGVREVPGHQVPGAEAVRHRGRGERHTHPRRPPREGGGRPPRRRGHGHEPPGSAERAGQHRGQVLRAAVQGVRGLRRPGLDPGVGRRQVPPGPDRQVPVPPRRRDPRRPGGQPQPPRGGRPGGGGHGSRQAGRDQRARGVLGALRCSCTATPPSPARAWWPRR